MYSQKLKEQIQRALENMNVVMQLKDQFKAEFTVDCCEELKISQLTDFQVELSEQLQKAFLDIQQIFKRFYQLLETLEQQNRTSRRDFLLLENQNFTLKLQLAELKENSSKLAQNFNKIEVQLKDSHLQRAFLQSQTQKLQNNYEIMLLSFNDLKKDLQLQRSKDIQTQAKKKQLIQENEQLISLKRQQDGLISLLRDQLKGCKSRSFQRERQSWVSAQEPKLNVRLNLQESEGLNFDMCNDESELAAASGKKETDFLFIHYLLLVQTTKINFDIQEWNAVDLKTEYSELIDTQVPLHEWTQWIQKKLQAKTGIGQKTS